jgi:hypothetical protein
MEPRERQPQSCYCESNAGFFEVTGIDTPTTLVCVTDVLPVAPHSTCSVFVDVAPYVQWKNVVFVKNGG